MHQHLLLESLRWFTRDDLDRIQPVCRMLRDPIVANAKVLPLRLLGQVNMGFRGRNKIELERVPRWLTFRRTDEELPPPDREAWLNDGDFDAILHLLKHTVIRQLRFDIMHSAYLQRILANAQDVDIIVEHICFSMPADPKPDDFATRDFIVALLQPLSSETESKEGKKRRYK